MIHLLEHKTVSVRQTFERMMDMKRFFYVFTALVIVFASMFSALSERGGVVIFSNLTGNDAFPLKGYKIGIDPGHQEKANSELEIMMPGTYEKKAKVASGTRGTTTDIPEYVTNLEVSLKLRDLLTALGAEVLMTRETHDVDISNQERAVMMNEWGADLVLRIHCNGSTDPFVQGMGMYVRYSGDAYQESYELGQALLKHMAEATGAKKAGVFKRNTYTGLNWSTVPSVIVEMGYMTNPEEDVKLNSADYQEKLVIGALNGILEYLKIEIN